MYNIEHNVMIMNRTRTTLKNHKTTNCYNYYFYILKKIYITLKIAKIYAH